MYFNENNFLNTANYGLTRQHNLISSSATTNNFSTFFDTVSSTHLLQYTLGSSVGGEPGLSSEPGSVNYNPSTPFNINESTLNIVRLLDRSSGLNAKQSLGNLFNYPEVVSELNSDSDKAIVNYPLLKLVNSNIGKEHSYNLKKFRNLNFLKGRGSFSTHNPILPQITVTNKVFSAVGADSKVLLSDQSVRQYEKVNPSSSNYNLSEGTNTLTSNLLLLNKTNPSSTMANTYLLNKSDQGDLSVLNHALSSRYYMEGSHYPNSSNNPSVNRVDHSSMDAQNVFFDVNKGSITKKLFTKKLDTVDLLQGAREKSPASINSAY